MGIGLAFWVLFLLWIVFSVWSHYPFSDVTVRKSAAGWLLVMALLFLLGWKVFGFIIQN